jgi:hypothetical protein
MMHDPKKYSGVNMISMEMQDYADGRLNKNTKMFPNDITEEGLVQVLDLSELSEGIKIS